MLNRTALEDAVFNTYPDIEMHEIERMPDDKLEWLLQIKRPLTKDAPFKRAPGRPRKEPATLWDKTNAGYELRDGALVHVETWRISNAAGETVREYVQHCGERVWYDGRMVSSSILRHFLQTGQWVKRLPKPKRYRAVIRTGRTVEHIGYFASRAERDAAVFAYRLGINPSK